MKTVLIVLFAVCGILSSLFWLMNLFISFIAGRKIATLDELGFETGAGLPKLSIILTARNEKENLEKAVRLRLEDDYEGLEVIIVDDRSEDGTGEIADNIAKSDGRVRVLHLKELPEKWLGKVHALHRGVEAASGDWLLFSDADIYVKPGTMKKAVGYCLRNNIDHLALIPEFYRSTFLLDACLSVFMRWICMMAAAVNPNNKKSKAAVGAGAFNLVKRSAFMKTKGFEWLRMELADDMALGRMMKESGAKCTVLNGKGCVGVHFYRTLGEVMVVFERTVPSAIGNFSLARVVAASCLVFMLEMMPFFLLFAKGAVLYAGIIFSVLAVISSVKINGWIKRPVLPAALIPIGTTLLSYALLRAGVLGAIRGGVYWRGTFYSMAEIKEGSRYVI